MAYILIQDWKGNDDDHMEVKDFFYFLCRQEKERLAEETLQNTEDFMAGIDMSHLPKVSSLSLPLSLPTPLSLPLSFPLSLPPSLSLSPPLSPAVSDPAEHG